MFSLSLISKCQLVYDSQLFSYEANHLSVDFYHGPQITEELNICYGSTQHGLVNVFGMKRVNTRLVP